MCLYDFNAPNYIYLYPIVVMQVCKFMIINQEMSKVSIYIYAHNEFTFF